MPAIGPYALQAAISAVHAEAQQASQTDWAQIVGLYDELVRVQPLPCKTDVRVGSRWWTICCSSRQCRNTISHTLRERTCAVGYTDSMRHACPTKRRLSELEA